jgi:hypothetical protein
MKTIELDSDAVSVELTEFELMTLAVLVEKGQLHVTVNHTDNYCIGQAINGVADEFKSLLGHFSLAQAS